MHAKTKRKNSMNRIFIGGLNSSVSTQHLQKLFAAESIPFINIQHSAGGGFAFVDCPDQNTADHAIEVLNGNLSQLKCFVFSGLFKLNVNNENV